MPPVPVHDTVRQRSEAAEHAGDVVDRSTIFLTQTPQGFHWDVLYASHLEAEDKGLRATDDGQLVAMSGGEPPRKVTWVLGERRNLKVTSPADLAQAEWIFGQPGWGLDVS